MPLRSLIYWVGSIVAAAIAVEAAEPEALTGAGSTFTPEELAAGTLLAVPEPSRALLLFLGILAMAFTYRRAWLNWKRGN